MDDLVKIKILLQNELTACGVQQTDSCYTMHIDNEEVQCTDLTDCMAKTVAEIKQLKQKGLKEWESLAHIADQIVEQPKYSQIGCLNNLLFLNNIRKVHELSLLFDELMEVSSSIQKLKYIDVSHVSTNLVKDFNDLYLSLRVLHTLILQRMYRNKVIMQIMKMFKTASITGPWSNLDLPSLERQWKFDSEEEEYFKNREDAKKNQARYNPTYDIHGVFFEWVDRNIPPYLWSDRATESPYKSRLQISIP